MDVVVEDQEYEDYEDPDEELAGLHPKSSHFADDIQKFDLRFLQFYKFFINILRSNVIYLDFHSTMESFKRFVLLLRSKSGF